MRTTFRMEDKNISMIKGDTLSFGIEIYNKDGTYFEEDLDSAFFSCKSNKSNSWYVFRKSLDDGISMSDVGRYAVRVAPEDTENVEAGKYFYDLQIEKNGDRFTVLKGILEIEEDVTF